MRARRRFFPSLSESLLTAYQGKEVVTAGEDRKDRAANQYVMKMSDDEKAVVRLKIERDGRDHDSGKATEYENGQTTESKQHRHRSRDAACGDGRQKTENLDAAGNRHSLRSRREKAEGYGRQALS